MRIHILGALEISRDDVAEVKLPPASHHLVAVLAAVGPDGIDRDDLAVELWSDPLPGSWKSALRNRMTAARRALGSDAILNKRGRFRLASHVSVDSWDLIAHELTLFDCDSNPLAFLDGEPLVDIEVSPLVFAHVAQVTEARAVLIQDAVQNNAEISALALQSLRVYQRQHALDRTVTYEAIRAHLAAGQEQYARQIVAEVQAQVPADKPASLLWVDVLDAQLEVNTRRRRRDDHEPTPIRAARSAEETARFDLFTAAMDDENWHLAFGIAMGGLPMADHSGGDLSRLELLGSIPIERLEGPHKFTLALTMTRLLGYVGRDEDSLEWADTTRRLAETPNQYFLASIVSAFIGTSTDERAPIPLPKEFDATPDEHIAMSALQVVTINHLERATHDVAAPLHKRFVSLVEASADPYRRWHLMTMQSMTLFLAGEIEAAATSARKAHKYASFFAIAEAELALIGQLSNARCVHPGFPGIDDVARDYPASASTLLSRALQAVRWAPADAGAGIDRFLREYNFHSRMFLTIPTLTLVAPYARDPELRADIAGRLRRRTGTSAIFSIGYMHLGPVDRALARVVETETEAEMHLAAAVHIADRQRTRLWQVVCRLDLAEVTGNAEHRRAASELATTPDLQKLVAEYQFGSEISGGSARPAG